MAWLPRASWPSCRSRWLASGPTWGLLEENRCTGGARKDSASRRRIKAGPLRGNRSLPSGEPGSGPGSAGDGGLPGSLLRPRGQSSAPPSRRRSPQQPLMRLRQHRHPRLEGDHRASPPKPTPSAAPTSPTQSDWQVVGEKNKRRRSANAARKNAQRQRRKERAVAAQLRP